MLNCAVGVFVRFFFLIINFLFPGLYVLEKE